ncbi:hypothetical protein AVEN_20777-1 [Araneus ventricosus]|uniref:Uncharacterized protein n=1 Tax=Araneus ventricosus TaxID=182803 RepID=A0A4Y2KLN0_ARAVE|nr:hypothetical protein AVEN_20777-1 [Araneus ventricosus]
MQEFPLLSVFLFVAPEDCCFVVTSFDKVSSTTSCREAQYNFFGGQFLAVVFLKLINSIFHHQSRDLGQRRNLVDCRLPRYWPKPLKDRFDNAFQSFFQEEVRVLLVTSYQKSNLTSIHLEAGNDVEVTFPKL